MKSVPFSEAFQVPPVAFKASAVKHFAALLVLLITASPLWAQSQSQCSKVHLEAQPSLHLDTTAFTRTWYSTVRKYTNYTPTDLNGNPIKVELPPKVKMAFDPRKMMDTAFMGILGRIFDLKYEPEQKKIVARKNEFLFPEEMSRTTELLRQAMAKPLSESFLKLVRSNFRMEQLSDQSTLIRLINFEDMKNPRPQDEVSTALRSRFMTMYLHMANWVYRLSNLEKNKGLSNATMMDETVQLIQSGRALHFHLLFDREVLKAQFHILQLRIDAYEASKDPKEKKDLLDLISQPNDPFLPFSGIIASVSFLNPHAPVEFKRYFKNDLEDPLMLIRPEAKNDFVQRHLMLAKAIEMLPEKTILEIHAHSLVHVRAYMKLGFKREKIIQNPSYPDVQIHLLKGQREDVLEKIRQLLQPDR